METSTVLLITLGVSTTLGIFAIIIMGKSIDKLRGLLKEAKEELAKKGRK